MKAISLLQPWASLVVMGIKTIETRSWNTKFRGEILIHSSLGKSGKIFSTEYPFKKFIKDFDLLPFGKIIGSVTITDVIPIANLFMNDENINKLTFEEKAFGDYSDGRFAWLLDDPRIFKKPLPARGMMSIWEYPGENFN